MELEFYGASSGEVTGSCHILRVNNQTILLDCGLIQGGKKQEVRNHEPFPFDASQIDAVVLSHAHIDHSGRLPLLVKRGFTGKIHTHNATVDLCHILLSDSASLAESEAERENKKNKGKGKPVAVPLYTIADAEETERHFVGHKYDEWFEVANGLKVRFQDAGHILGSAIVEMIISEAGETRKVVYSGDIGQFDTPILQDPTFIDEADMVFMESTYGGRIHRDRNETIKEIGEIIAAAKAGKGNILIPAFSIGRTQEVLYHCVEHYQEWGLENWKIYLDSPMAIKASKVYWEFDHLHDMAAKRLLGDFSDRIPLPNYHHSLSTQDSQKLNEIKSGAIFIAGSGMCNGGRILHHLRHNIYREQSHIIFVGYQAEGTLGRRIVDGAKTIKMFGDELAVKAQIHTVGGLSAHADQHDLTKWLSRFSGKPKLFLVHGERESQETFKAHIEKTLEWDVDYPDVGFTVDLKTLAKISQA